MDIAKTVQASMFAAVSLVMIWSCAPREDPNDIDSSPPAHSSAASRRLQTLVDETFASDPAPGLAVALAEGDQEAIVAVTGHADLEKEIPIGIDTPFFIGSISKNLFAVIVLQLAEEGLLGLDDPLASYVEWPRGDEIRIRMLLNHTSGIPDYFGSLSLSDSEGGIPEFFSERHSPRDILRMMPDHDPIFDPGTQQRYSNTNGLLVGLVVERVTGSTLGEALDERIVQRLGLEHTYLYDQTTIDRPRARGYCGMPGWSKVAGQIIDCSFADEALIDSADGSIVSTAGDLLRYHRALRNDQLLTPESWEAMRRVQPGSDNGLGYLVMTGTLGPHEGNVGRAMGHLAASIYYVELDLFVVMMLNRGDAALPLRQLMESWIDSE